MAEGDDGRGGAEERTDAAGGNGFVGCGNVAGSFGIVFEEIGNIAGGTPESAFFAGGTFRIGAGGGGGKLLAGSHSPRPAPPPPRCPWSDMFATGRGGEAQDFKQAKLDKEKATEESTSM